MATEQKRRKKGKDKDDRISIIKSVRIKSRIVPIDMHFNFADFLQQQGGGGGGKNQKHPRWNKDSDAAKFLERALKSGEIDPNESPKTVHERYPMFSVYKLENFRQQFNKLKTEMGLHVRRDNPDVQLDPSDFECKYYQLLFLFIYLFVLTIFVDLNDFEDYGVGNPSNYAKKRKANEPCVIGGMCSELEEDVWAPPRKIYLFSDAKSRDKMVVTVWLPSGVGESFTFKLLEENTVLELSVQWPWEYYNADALYQPIKKQITADTLADHLLKTAAMKKESEAMLERKENRMWSRTRINLPKPCTGDMEPSLMVGKRGSYILSIDLFVLIKETLKVRTGAGLTRK